jgi:uncharacterized protein YndB with AHSA1/START domain
MSESLHTVDGRTVLRMERRLSHPPEKVWRALTEPAHISRWFPSDMEMDLRQGGTIRFVFRAGEGPTMEGAIKELDPPKVFAYTWGEELLRWELHPDGDGTLLVLEHSFADHYGAADFAAGWHTCINALAALLASRPVPLDDDPFQIHQLHEQYVHVLGLDQGTVRTTADGWVVRFERQLAGPVEAAWAALVGGQAPAAGDPAPAAATVAGVPALAVTAAEPPRLLEYAWGGPGGAGPTGLVRWELAKGTWHGARLVLTQTGPAGRTAERDAALAAWATHVDQLAERLLAGQAAGPPAAK